jgi:hypothetical protein
MCVHELSHWDIPEADVGDGRSGSITGVNVAAKISVFCTFSLALMAVRDHDQCHFVVRVPSHVGSAAQLAV